MTLFFWAFLKREEFAVGLISNVQNFGLNIKVKRHLFPASTEPSLLLYYDFPAVSGYNWSSGKHS